MRAADDRLSSPQAMPATCRSSGSCSVRSLVLSALDSLFGLMRHPAIARECGHREGLDHEQRRIFAAQLETKPSTVFNSDVWKFRASSVRIGTSNSASMDLYNVNLRRRSYLVVVNCPTPSPPLGSGFASNRLGCRNVDFALTAKGEYRRRALPEIARVMPKSRGRNPRRRATARLAPPADQA